MKAVIIFLTTIGEGGPTAGAKHDKQSSSQRVWSIPSPKTFSDILATTASCVGNCCCGSYTAAGV
jgi:hypothetical protein